MSSEPVWRIKYFSNLRSQRIAAIYEGKREIAAPLAPADAARIVNALNASDRALAAERRAGELRKLIVDSATVCTLKGCEHCKWLGFNLGRYESLEALAGTAERDGTGREG